MELTLLTSVLSILSWAISPTAVDLTSPASRFPPTLFFNQRVRNSPLDVESEKIILNLSKRGGWGRGHLRIDYMLDVYYRDENSRLLRYQDDGTYKPDSDSLDQMPVPSNFDVGFESSKGRICDGGDCHYLVVDDKESRLIECFIASAAGDVFHCKGALVVWPYGAHQKYPENLRGDVCTSADAGGFPIAPMLFSVEEVAAGAINHAIRFILPNERIQHREYVRPATHGTGGPIWAKTNGVPYGARFRLKTSPTVEKKIKELKPGARVVAVALKEFGMILSDGGEDAFTARSDRYSKLKWKDYLEADDLKSLLPEDFEMIEGGTRLKVGECTRH